MIRKRYGSACVAWTYVPEPSDNTVCSGGVGRDRYDSTKLLCVWLYDADTRDIIAAVDGIPETKRFNSRRVAELWCESQLICREYE